MATGSQKIVLSVTAPERECLLKEEMLRADLRTKVESSSSKGKWFTFSISVEEAEDLVAQAAAAAGQLDDPAADEIVTKMNERIEAQLEKYSQ